MKSTHIPTSTLSLFLVLFLILCSKSHAQMMNATSAQKQLYYQRVQSMIQDAYLQVNTNYSYTFRFNQQTEQENWQLIGSSVFTTTTLAGQSQSVIQKLTAKKLVSLLQDGTTLACQANTWTNATKTM